MKIKRTTYGEFIKRVSGFKRLCVEREDHNISSNGTMMPIIYRVVTVYRKKQNCTYVAMCCLGYIDLFGPSDNDLLYIVKMDGRVTVDDLIDKKLAHYEVIKMLTEELWNKRRERLNKEES